MKTKLLKPTESVLKKASRLIRRGSLVAFPTETVYGLGGNALLGSSSQKIFEAKGRPSDNPLIVHIAEIDEAFSLSSDLPGNFFKLAEKFWPGPLTMIVPKSDIVPFETTGGLDTVAIRMPNNETALDLIRLSGVPIAAPSANSSGKPSPTKAEHVFEDLAGKIPIIIDAGNCNYGVESTVISLVGEPIILRPGAVTKEMIEEVIGPVQISDAVTSPLKEGEKVQSPGMKYKHYAPNCEVFIFEGNSEEFSEFLASIKNKDGVYALCFDEEINNLPVPYLTFGTVNDEFKQASLLFSRLREFDELGASVVYVHSPSREGIGLAVYNRLLRASGFKIIEANRKKIIGLCGQSGSGKTTLSKIFEENDFFVINADLVARKVSDTDKAIKLLSENFGEEIIENGVLNRKALGNIVFNNKGKLELLNKTLLPLISEEILKAIDKADRKFILLDAPTLFESGMNNVCHLVIGVIAPFDLLKERIMKRDSLTEEEAISRLSSQKSDQFFKDNCDIIIENNNDISAFESKAYELLNSIKEK